MNPCTISPLHLEHRIGSALMFMTSKMGIGSNLSSAAELVIKTDRRHP
jgi:hypothetical protein